MYTTREGEMKDMDDPEWLKEFKSVLDHQLYSAATTNGQLNASADNTVNQQPQQQGPFQDQQGRLYAYDESKGGWYYLG